MKKPILIPIINLGLGWKQHPDFRTVKVVDFGKEKYIKPEPPSLNPNSNINYNYIIVDDLDDNKMTNELLSEWFTKPLFNKP